MGKALEPINEKPYWYKGLRLSLWIVKFMFRYGFIPYIIYRGYILCPDHGWLKFSPLALMGFNFEAIVDNDDEDPLPDT